MSLVEGPPRNDRSPPLDRSAEARAKLGPKHPRIYLWDVMVAVMAIAVGLAIGKLGFARIDPRLPIPPRYRLFGAVERTHAVVFPCVAALTLAVLPLQLRRSRLALSRVLTQPGVVACSIAILQLAEGAMLASLAMTSPRTFALALSPAIGISIAAAWLIVAFNGRWKSEAGWDDRIGRALGVCWIIMPLALIVAYFFS
jgi:hypothetical protein